MRPIAIDRALNFDLLEAFVSRGQPGSEPTEALRPFSGLTSAPLDLFICQYCRAQRVKHCVAREKHNKFIQYP